MDYLLNGLPYFPGTTVFGTGLFADGTAAAPTVSFTNDPDTGLYLIGANNIGVAANGAKVLDVASTGLTVTGALGASSLTSPASTNLTLAGGAGNSSIILTPAGTGNVGIGTTGPNSQLDVYKASTGGKLRLSSNTNATYGELIFSSNDANYLTYGSSIEGTGDSNGLNVGDSGL